MSESEYRFVRDKEKTSELLERLYRELQLDKLDPQEHEGYFEIFYSQFIMKDLKTGKSHHVFSDARNHEKGMVYGSSRKFEDQKKFFHQLAVDRSSPIIFYFRANRFQVNLDGTLTPVY